MRSRLSVMETHVDRTNQQLLEAQNRTVRIENEYKQRLDTLSLEKSEQHDSLMSVESKLAQVTEHNQRMQSEVIALRRSTVALSAADIKLDGDQAAENIIKQLEIGTTVQSAARATAQQVARQVAEKKCPGEPAAAEAAALKALREYDSARDAVPSGVTQNTARGGSKGDKSFTWWMKNLQNFPKWPGDRAIRNQPRVWDDYWEAIHSFKAQTGCPENIMVQCIIHKLLKGLSLLRLASSCGTHMRMKTCTLINSLLIVSRSVLWITRSPRKVMSCF